MKKIDKLENATKNQTSTRRKFLSDTGKVVTLVTALPLLNTISNIAMAKTAKETGTGGPISVNERNATLLKNGFIVDGTGKKGFQGNLLIFDDKIAEISDREIRVDGEIVDCSGLVVMPGIIDAHSHMDGVVPIRGHEEYKTPYIDQGITTFVAGQCGFGPAGFRKDNVFLDALNKKKFLDLYSIEWNTMSQYFDHIKEIGINNNLMSLVGYGTSRISIRGHDPSPLSKDEQGELFSLLEQAMDEGAAGVSFGLQYSPGTFVDTEELRKVARLVKKKDKILSVHVRAYSALAPGYPMSTARVLLDYIMPFDGYTPHNLLAIDEVLDVARETGVRLQIAHLIFVGDRTLKTCDGALERIDQAKNQGVDVKFDTYSYPCGQTTIAAVYPAWFLKEVPAAFSNKEMLEKLESEWSQITRFLGFGMDKIQITFGNHPELNQYNGMFIPEIAKKRGEDWFKTMMFISQKSNLSAGTLNYGYLNAPVLHDLMKHPDSIFMTDAFPIERGIQNPCMYGGFPRFFQMAREHKVISLEETVYKSSGAATERYQIKDRGFLRKGLAADITILDWNNIRDNNTKTETNQKPSGIESVFINGRRVLAKGKTDGSILAGRIVT